MGQLWPAGRIRPVNLFNPVRWSCPNSLNKANAIFAYVHHCTRNNNLSIYSRSAVELYRIHCGPRVESFTHRSVNNLHQLVKQDVSDEYYHKVLGEVEQLSLFLFLWIKFRPYNLPVSIYYRWFGYWLSRASLDWTVFGYDVFNLFTQHVTNVQ